MQDILLSSDEDIAGYQFNISGADILSASGGASAANDFTVNVSGSTVLAFSFSGGIIPASENVLATELSIIALSDEICLTDIVVTSASGEPLY